MWNFKYTYSVSVLNVYALYIVETWVQNPYNTLYFYNVTVPHSLVLNMLVYTP